MYAHVRRIEPVNCTVCDEEIWLADREDWEAEDYARTGTILCDSPECYREYHEEEPPVCAHCDRVSKLEPVEVPNVGPVVMCGQCHGEWKVEQAGPSVVLPL